MKFKYAKWVYIIVGVFILVVLVWWLVSYLLFCKPFDFKCGLNNLKLWSYSLQNRQSLLNKNFNKSYKKEISDLPSYCMSYMDNLPKDGVQYYYGKLTGVIPPWKIPGGYQERAYVVFLTDLGEEKVYRMNFSKLGLVMRDLYVKDKSQFKNKYPQTKVCVTKAGFITQIVINDKYIGSWSEFYKELDKFIRSGDVKVRVKESGDNVIIDENGVFVPNSIFFVREI